MLRTAIGVISTLAVQSVFACSCVPPRASDEAEVAARLARSDEIIRVAVLETMKDQQTGTSYRVRVLESLRSPSAANDEVVVVDQHSTCALSMAVGEQWLLFLWEGRTAHMCSGSRPLDNLHPTRVLQDIPEYRATVKRDGEKFLNSLRRGLMQGRPTE